MRSKLILAAVVAALFVSGAAVPKASAQIGAYGRFARGYSSYYGGYGARAYSYGYRPYYAGYAAPYGYTPYYGGYSAGYVAPYGYTPYAGGYSAGYAAPYGYGSYSYGYRPSHGSVYYYGWQGEPATTIPGRTTLVRPFALETPSGGTPRRYASAAPVAPSIGSAQHET